MTMSEREYIAAIRRSAGTIISALAQPDGRERRAILMGGVFAVLQAHERYSGATRGTAAILKPLVVLAIETTEEHGGLLKAFVRAIEIKYGFGLSHRERNACDNVAEAYRTE